MMATGSKPLVSERKAAEPRLTCPTKTTFELSLATADEWTQRGGKNTEDEERLAGNDHDVGMTSIVSARNRITSAALSTASFYEAEPR